MSAPARKRGRKQKYWAGTDRVAAAAGGSGDPGPEPEPNPPTAHMDLGGLLAGLDDSLGLTFEDEEEFRRDDENPKPPSPEPSAKGRAPRRHGHSKRQAAAQLKGTLGIADTSSDDDGDEKDRIAAPENHFRPLVVKSIVDNLRTRWGGWTPTYAMAQTSTIDGDNVISRFGTHISNKNVGSVARTVLQAEQRQYFVVDPPTDLPLPGMLQGRDHWEGILEDQTTQRERNARLPAIAGQVLAAPVSGLAGAVGNVATELGGVRTELAALPERVLMGLAGHFAATTPTSGTADSPAAEPSSITRPSPVVTPAGPGLEAREKIAGVLHNFDVAMSAAVTRNELAEIKKGHQGGKRALVFNQERLWKMWKESGMELDDFLAQEKFANLKTVNAFYNVDRQKRSKKEEQGE